MGYTNWSLSENEERLANAVKEAKTIAAVCTLLGLAPKGGNYLTIKHHIVRLNLSTEHHVGQSWNRGNYKTAYSSRNKNTIKAALIRERGHVCESCGITTWLDNPAPLELDHINGQNNDHRLDNLRLLCCNCHAQTPTWRGRNR